MTQLQAEQRNDRDNLTVMVDKHSLSKILSMLELICQGKAEHLRINRQEPENARKWDHAAMAIYTLARENKGL